MVKTVQRKITEFVQPLNRISKSVAKSSFVLKDSLKKTSSRVAFGQVNKLSGISSTTAVESAVVEMVRIDPIQLQTVGTIVESCYNEVITKPELLRKYKNFSPQTYGESTLALVSKLIDECDLAGKVFVDLGSGVGQVCMMIAALSNASRCFGIEIMDHPAHYAIELLSRFQSCSQDKGVKHAPVELVHGDFLKSSAVRDAISHAGLVYMNNPRFGPELNLKVLNELCPLMPKGCKLICFDSLIGTRGLNRHPDDVLTYQKLVKVGDGAVSWKHHGVDLHVLERI